jgi:large subunit ribosomal protein L19
MDALKLISESSLKSEAPVLEVGDTVRVHVKIKEGDKFRILNFEGTGYCQETRRNHETFTVSTCCSRMWN